ncbi:MAG: GNAT family N-acetyltransferase [Pseudomonadota bacterium]
MGLVWRARSSGAADARGGVFLHALHVTAGARRRGGARRLIGAALATAQNRAGAEIAHAACLVSNAPAQALFASLGFIGRGGYVYWVAPD